MFIKKVLHNYMPGAVAVSVNSTSVDRIKFNETSKSESGFNICGLIKLSIPMGPLLAVIMANTITAKSCNPDLLIFERDSNHTESNQIQAQLSPGDIARLIPINGSNGGRN